MGDTCGGVSLQIKRRGAKKNQANDYRSHRASCFEYVLGTGALVFMLITVNVN